MSDQWRVCVHHQSVTVQDIYIALINIPTDWVVVCLCPSFEAKCWSL